MENLEFYKMSGHGNDFILVDNRDGRVAESDMVAITRAACRRRLSIGADGMVFIINGPDDLDFAWRFFNDDGSEAEMCGNAARCVARFAQLNGIAGKSMSFLTLAGIIKAEVGADGVKVQMTKPGPASLDQEIISGGKSFVFSSINTGVPHVVQFVDDLESAPVTELGREIRFHEKFGAAGTNVNFTKILDRHSISVRTYERGVEGETLACGTGCIAAVLLAELKGEVDSPVKVMTRGGEELMVYYTREKETFSDLFLEGPVRIVSIGRFGPDTLI